MAGFYPIVVQQLILCQQADGQQDSQKKEGLFHDQFLDEKIDHKNANWYKLKVNWFLNNRIKDCVGISPFGLHLPNFILHFVALQSLS